MERATAQAPTLAVPRFPWYLLPSLHLILNILLTAVSELLLKRGAMETAQVEAPRWLEWTGIMTLGSGWVLVGIVIYILAFLNWLYVLRWVPLSIAYPVTSAVFVLIALGAWLFLGERIGGLRSVGILLITLGIVFCARPAAAAEEAL